ncbi:MAG: hypothetical protein E6J27_05300 [Chloroflexi bacterium]|nr:MAG: hypothetical protein E6J27_05300 [Chloroflexota bacterium]
MGRWASQSLTRRELIRRGAIGGAAVAIAACAPAAVAPSARPSATPKRGGTLTWAQWDKNDDLDPATPTGGASLEILGNVLDTLILMDDDQKAYPLLATEWKSDPDAKRFTFTLRDDVTFHDGSRLDSSAVKRTWDRILDPKTKSTRSSRLSARGRIGYPAAARTASSRSPPTPTTNGERRCCAIRARPTSIH